MIFFKPIPNTMYSDEDAFIFGNSKKRKDRKAKREKRREARKADPKIIARKERREDFGRKLGQVYRDVGGASGIGRAIDNLTTPTNTNLANNSNISFGLASDTINEPSPDRTKGIPPLVYVLGAVLVIGTISLVIINKRKQQRS